MSLNIVTETDNRVQIKNVLMSVSDKTGLEEFVPRLVKACPGVKIYSTGGTYTKIKEIRRFSMSPRILNYKLPLRLGQHIFKPDRHIDVGSQKRISIGGIIK